MRQSEIRCAEKLQKFLGPEYEVQYDALDSGMTEIYYNGTRIKRVPNSEMKPDLNVNDFTVGANRPEAQEEKDMTRETIEKAWEAVDETIRLEDQIINLMDDEDREHLHAELAPCWPTVFIAAYAAGHDDFDHMLRRQMGIETSDLLADADEMINCSDAHDADMLWRIEDADLPDEVKDAATAAANLIILLNEDEEARMQ